MLISGSMRDNDTIVDVIVTLLIIGAMIFVINRTVRYLKKITRRFGK